MNNKCSQESVHSTLVSDQANATFSSSINSSQNGSLHHTCSNPHCFCKMTNRRKRTRQALAARLASNYSRRRRRVHWVAEPPSRLRYERQAVNEQDFPNVKYLVSHAQLPPSAQLPRNSQFRYRVGLTPEQLCSRQSRYLLTQAAKFAATLSKGLASKLRFMAKERGINMPLFEQEQGFSGTVAVDFMEWCEEKEVVFYRLPTPQGWIWLINIGIGQVQNASA